MYDLTREREQSGYHSGYSQGFRDGQSGIFGEEVTESLLRRLEEQYPHNEPFRAGYVDGFKDGVSRRGVSWARHDPHRCSTSTSGTCTRA